MSTESTWAVELAICWTLNHSLPQDYRTDNPILALHNTSDYIIRLETEIIKLESENINDSSTMGMTNNLTDNEELKLLQELGLNTESEHFRGAEMDWISPCSTGTTMENPVTKPVFKKLTEEEEDNHDTTINYQGNAADNKKVKRPGNGFIRFSTEKRKEFSMMYPKYDNREVSKILGLMWRKLSPAEKQPYIQQFDEDMNKIRSEHPEWNYAGSRAKIATLLRSEVDACIVQSQRLRPRNHSLPEVMQNLKSNPPRPKKQKTKKQKQNISDLWIMCELCYQWRKLPPDTNRETLPEYWDCSMNSDPLFNNCNIPEEVHI